VSTPRDARRQLTRKAAAMADTAEKSPASPRFVLTAVISAALLILAAGVLILFSLRQNPNYRGILSAPVGGPFHLIDQNGRPFTDADLKGKWHLVFFGFTHCDDVCPTTLHELSAAVGRLAPDRRDEVGIVFISVDPRRDTPAVLKSYLTKFAAPIVGLTGSAADVRQAAGGYHVYYGEHPTANGDYDVDHGAFIYVMDPQGRFSGTITPETAAPQIASRLRRLLS
jgi:protein SCO1